MGQLAGVKLSVLRLVQRVSPSSGGSKTSGDSSTGAPTDDPSTIGRLKRTRSEPPRTSRVTPSPGESTASDSGTSAASASGVAGGSSGSGSGHPENSSKSPGGMLDSPGRSCGRLAQGFTIAKATATRERSAPTTHGIHGFRQLGRAGSVRYGPSPGGLEGCSWGMPPRQANTGAAQNLLHPWHFHTLLGPSVHIASPA